MIERVAIVGTGLIGASVGLALRRAGCERVFLVSRPGEPVFGTQVSGLLGAAPAESARLFQHGGPDSDFDQAVRESDATVCFDWDDKRYDVSSMKDLLKMADDAYLAPIAIAGCPVANRSEASAPQVLPVSFQSAA